MLRNLILGIVLIGVTIGLVRFVPTFLSQKSTQSEQTQAPVFQWGVHMSAFSLHQPNQLYSPELTTQKINDAKKLGVTHVRTNIQLFPDGRLQEDVNDQWLGALSGAGFQILGILEPSLAEPIDLKKDYETIGYNLAKPVAVRYQGKIGAYQLANEVTGTIARKPDAKGPIMKGAFVEYDQNAYLRMRGLLKGMTRAIRESDPKAKIVLSGHAIYYDLFDYFKQDGLDWDVIGWAWYSTDGDDPTVREYNYGDHFNLAEKLASYAKEVVIIESNYDHGSFPLVEGETRTVAEKKQADWLATFAENVYRSGYFQGFYAFTMYDDPYGGLERDRQWGIVAVDENEPTLKPAFTAYQKVIQRLR